MKAETHPAERVLPLAPSAIGQLQQAAAKAETPPKIDRHADFIVYPLPPEPPS